LALLEVDEARIHRRRPYKELSFAFAGVQVLLRQSGGRGPAEEKELRKGKDEG